MMTRERRFDPIRNRWLIVSTDQARRLGDRLMGDNGLNIGQEVIVSCLFCNGSEGKTPTGIFVIREVGPELDSPGWKARAVPNNYPAPRPQDNDDRYATDIFEVVDWTDAHANNPPVTTIAGLELGLGLFMNPTSQETSADCLRGKIGAYAYKDSDKNKIGIKWDLLTYKVNNFIFDMEFNRTT